jgi:alpha-L-fucosidase
MLVDIVSKNGNLLLNIVQRPDGSLDAEVEKALEELAVWAAIHGEAIYGTRPWLVYGEGAVKAKGGGFMEDFKYTAKDIRFTTKAGVLYAFAMGWPEDGQLTIRSLAQPADADAAGNAIASVSLLGYDGKVKWTQTTNGLVVKLPAQRVSNYTAALRITGTGLQPVTITAVTEPITPDNQGNLLLRADDAELHGQQIKQESQGGQTCIGFWDRAEEWVSWNVRFPGAGRYQVSADCATVHPGSPFVLEIAGQSLPGKAPQTAGWDKFVSIDLGVIEIKQAGHQQVKLRPQAAATWQPMNLRSVRFTKAQ